MKAINDTNSNGYASTNQITSFVHQEHRQYGWDKKFAPQGLPRSRGALVQGRKELTSIDSSFLEQNCRTAQELPQRRDVLTERYWEHR